MGKIAYELREEYAGTVEQVEHEGADPVEVPLYTGGLIRAGDEDLNIRELLDEGDGVIVVDDRDPRIALALDEYPPLKRCAVPEGAEPIAGDYRSQTVTALRQELKRRDIAGGGNLNLEDAATVLETHDLALEQEVALGDNPSAKTILELELETTQEG